MHLSICLASIYVSIYVPASIYVPVPVSVPGRCLNTITATIASNVPLFSRCPTCFVLAGFRDASTATGVGVRADAPTTPFASGPLSLTGFQHLEHDNTTWANAKNIWCLQLPFALSRMLL